MAERSAEMPKKLGLFGNKRKKKQSASEFQTSKGYQEKIVAGQMDLSFFIIIMILLVIGIVMMFSASYAWAIHEQGNGLYYVKKQVLFAAMGIAAMLVISCIDYHFLRKAWVAYGAAGGTLMLLVLVLLIGEPLPGTDIRRWIFGFQPSELMKATLVILFAFFISNNYKKMNKFSYGILPFGMILAVVSLLLLKEPHLSATIIIIMIGGIMIFVGGANIPQLFALALAGSGGLGAVLIYMKSKGMDYFGDRIDAWLNPFTAADTWQTRQSLIAIGSGGIFGLGLGNSRQKYLYLPESQNDFVFSVVCEELGFIGAAVIILLFALFVFRGFYIATKAPDKFGMMLVVGFTAHIGLQALLNIAVVTNAIPNTGISLPFFSSGGTALVMQLCEMGVILNVSRQALMES